MKSLKTKISNAFSLKQLLNTQFNSSDLISLKQEDTEALQAALLAMYQDIIDACEPYGVKPILQGGTLLGKVRHNGFIPWDDDLDLGMSRKDYENFKKIFREKLADRYILSAPNSDYPAVARFIQIYKKNSYYEAFAHRRDAPKKIYIDIFPIDYAPDHGLVRAMKGYYSNLLMLLAGCAEYKQNIEPHIKQFGEADFPAKTNLLLRSVLGSLASIKPLPKWYDSVDAAIRSNKTSNICTSGTGRKHYLGECVPADVFFPLKETTFCGVKAWMPNKENEYLRNLYGANYMQVPPEEEREHHFVKGFKI